MLAIFILLATVFLGFLIAYWIIFFTFEYQDEATTKKQYLKGCFIPFYWWGVHAVEIINGMIKRYKDLI